MKNMLIESLTEALETTAFMLPLPPEEPLPAPAKGILVQIDFNGPVHGTIQLYAGSELAGMVAANVMGLEPDDQDAQTKSTDAVKELVNIIAGILLTKLACSPADIFNLTVPRADEQPDSQSWEQYIMQDDVTVLEVDGFPLAIRLLTTTSADLS
jgi:CheY-specific phosphatase CheX